MKSQILSNINNYVIKRLIQLSGVFLIFTGIFLLATIVTYSPSDPNFIYNQENSEIENIGGFYGSFISDFLLQSFGLISFFLIINFLSWGQKLIANKIVNNFTPKIFYLLLYIIFGTTALNILYNDSFWLIDNGNGGFVGRAIKENIYYYTPLIENEYVTYVLILLAIIFFTLSANIKLNEVNKILILPFAVIKKLINFFKKDKINSKISPETQNDYMEIKNLEDNFKTVKQPILPFSKIKINKKNNIDDNFRLPLLNFLEKNPDLKN